MKLDNGITIFNNVSIICPYIEFTKSTLNFFFNVCANFLPFLSNVKMTYGLPSTILQSDCKLFSDELPSDVATEENMEKRWKCGVGNKPKEQTIQPKHFKITGVFLYYLRFVLSRNSIVDFWNPKTVFMQNIFICVRLYKLQTTTFSQNTRHTRCISVNIQKTSRDVKCYRSRCRIIYLVIMCRQHLIRCFRSEVPFYSVLLFVR